MEAGSNSLPSRKRGRPWLTRTVGIVLLSFGLFLITISLGYFIYSKAARDRLGALESTSSLRLPEITVTAPLSPTITKAYSRLVTSTLYPANVLRPQDWAEPLWTDNLERGDQPEFLSRYLPVDWDNLPPPNQLMPPKRIRIPAINLDATVEGLQIIDLGNSRAYETPKFIVGHIPETSNPGGSGNGWYFGHLETRIRGEGAIFRDLPDLAALIRGGNKVYVTVDDDRSSHLYQITNTRVIPAEQLSLTDTQEPTITLVTCVPPLTYDHRLLVEAKLVGFLPGQSS